MINIKGGIDLVNFVIFSAVMLLLSIGASLLIPQLSIESNLSSTINADKNQYRTYMATATYLNEDATNNLTQYRFADDKARIKSHLETRAGKILCPLSSTYSLELSRSDLLIKNGKGARKYSAVLVASPSKELTTVTIGLGKMRAKNPNSLVESCPQSDYP